MHCAPIARLVAGLALLVSVLALHTVDWKKTQILVAYDPALAPTQEALSSLFQLDPGTYQLTFVDYADATAELFLGEDALYHHAVFLASAKKAVGAKDIVNKHKLLEFFNKGGNVLAVGLGENSVPEEVRLFLAQAGVHPAPKGFLVGDHFNREVKIGADNVVPNRIVADVGPVDYVGAAALLSNSPYLIPLVKAPRLSYCASPKDSVLTPDRTWTTGDQGFLAVAFQGLNNARGAWVGSLDLLTPSLISWVFQESGVLKLQFVEHYKASEPGVTDRTLYRIKDDAYYTVGVSELKGGEWVPYVPALEDDVLQLSFKMLDPYQRLNLTLLGPGASTENGKNDLNIFYTEFTLPDHHGMFTFEFDYKRLGLSFLEDKRIVTVRHLANDEFKRSWDITNSWMYVASAGAVVVAWFVFVANFLYLGNAPAKTGEKTSEKAKAKKSDEKKSEKEAEK